MVRTGAAAALGLIGIACAVQRVEDTELGLSKADVFSTPDPIVATVQAAEPGENENLGRYFSEAPPLIPHVVEDFLPIRATENMCADCHMLPDEIGAQAQAGEPTPIPASHYTDLRRDPDTVGEDLVGARFDCMSCHAVQSAAAPLVTNTYRQ
jgi:cytochrome c-type protein NapB